MKQKKTNPAGRYADRVSEPMVGVAEGIQSGAFYVKSPQTDTDVYVSARNGGNTLTGDKVEFLLRRKSSRGGLEGRITRVLERTRKQFVGTAQVHEHAIFVRFDPRRMPHDFYLSRRENPLVQDGDKVVVRVADWAEGENNPRGELIEVLGRAGQNDTEMHAILAEYGLPHKFDKSIEDAAEKIPAEITKEDLKTRRDFRHVTTFTIDPADAKDFDDALSLRRTDDGLWEVGVHIADVTHYISPKSTLDTEAEERGTSVYLVDRTIPMLPERLSNELCSLRPDEEKLCFSAVFTLDDDARMRSEWFGRTVIRSDRRFAYEQAQAVIEGGDDPLKEQILALNGLAQKLRKERFKNGAVSFQREEAKFSLDADGKPTGVYFKVQKEANELIEEFMLLANRRVATFCSAKGKTKRTMVYRVHDAPDAEKLEKFRAFVLRFGYIFKAAEGHAIAKEMNKLMGAVRGKFEENVISTLAIRSMSKAYYSTENIGHYGLAFPYYTHFTSPIRRYPDMMVHRLLQRYLDNGKSADHDTFEQLCEHASEREVVAAEAERASIKYKMVEFLTERIGEEFDGQISGMSAHGIYVELEQTHIEGMIPLREMQDDIYQFDENRYEVYGVRTRRIFVLGDRVRIRVRRADLSRRQIDFDLVAHQGVLYAPAREIPIRRTPSAKGFSKRKRR